MRVKDRVRKFFKEEKEFTILLHTHADPDALGAAIALKEFLRLRGKKAYICTESLNKASKFLLDRLNERIEYRNSRNLVVLDTSSFVQLGKYERFLEEAENVCVIDHHRENKFEDYLCLKEDRTSVAEIIYDIIDERNKKINLAILAGILTDTGFFKFANAKTFKTVIEILDSGIEMYEAFELFKMEADLSRRIAILKSLKRLKLKKIKGKIVVTTYVGSHESTVASFLLGVSDLVIVSNLREKRLIARASQNLEIDLSEIMRRIEPVIEGEGGGHKKSAGACGKKIEDGMEEVLRILEEKL